MANYLIKPVGSVDLRVIEKSRFRGVKFKPHRYTRNPNSFEILNSARDGAKIIYKQISSDPDLLDFISFPLIESGIKFCNNKKLSPLKLILVLTDQKINPGEEAVLVNNDTGYSSRIKDDTVYLGKIIEKKYEQTYKSELIVLRKDTGQFDIEYGSIYRAENVYSIKVDDLGTFNSQYESMNQYFENGSKFDFLNDTVIVYTEAGMPETRYALLLHCIQRFRYVIQIETSADRITAMEQKFPKEFFKSIRENVAPYALKEILATISARNFSHTEGSHVLKYVRDRIEGLSEKIEKTLDCLENLNILSIEGINDKIEAIKESVRQIRELNLKSARYTHGLMEYLADLSGHSSGNLFFEYNLNDIVDELIDINYQFLGKGLIDNKTIDGNDVRVNLEYRDGNKSVLIPGGEIGKHAFYSIIKNLVRNVYKHSTVTDKNQISIKIIAHDSSEFPEYQMITVHDKRIYSKEDADKIIYGNGCSRGINKLIDDNLLDENGMPRREGWGIIEMKIAAFYLTGLPFEYFNKVEESGRIITKDFRVFPNPLQIVKIESDKNDGVHLGYRFHMIKPKNFFITGMNGNLNATIYELKDRGIAFYNGSRVDFNYTIPFKFILDNNNLFDHKNWKLKNIRYIQPDHLEIEELTKPSVRKELYLNWLTRYFDLKKAELIASPKKPVTQPKQKHYIVIDPHGEGHKEMDFRDIKALNYLYYTTRCSRDNYDIKAASFLTLLPEDFEAVFTKIIVLDERIQKQVNREINYIQKLSLRDLLELKGVYIPTCDDTGFHNPDQGLEDFCLQHFAGEEVSPDEFVKFEKKLKQFMNEYNYVILHLSIFEKLASFNKCELKEYYSEFVDPSGKNYLILLSGRGTPSTIPIGSYYINLSTLEHAINRLSKPELVQTLNSVRIKI
jgi:hypothetical protein